MKNSLILGKILKIMELSKFNNVNVHISPTAILGKNVRIGDNTVIYDNVDVYIISTVYQAPDSEFH